MKTKPFHQPEGDYCKDCPHLMTTGDDCFIEFYCIGLKKQIKSNGWFEPIRLADCKAEDE